MKTITLQIGNSDDKLTQKEWSAFVAEINGAVSTHTAQIHFSGGSINWSEWQNYTIVFEIAERYKKALINKVAAIREFYRQDSIAWTEGETLFV